MKKRIGRTLIAAILVSSMMVTPVFAAPASVDDLKKNKEAAQGEVSALQTELTTLLNKLDKLESTLISKGQEVIQANDELDEAQETEKQQYEDMKLRIKYMYEEGDSSYIQKLLESKSISDLLNQAEYMQEVHSYDRQKLQEYVETKNQIADLKSTLETEMANLESAQKEYESEQTKLSNTIEEKKDEVANFDEQLQAAAAAAAEEAAKRAAAQQQASAKPSKPSGSTSKPSGGGGSSKPSGGGSSNSDANVKPPSGGGGQAVVNYAMQFVGNPYVWGGTSLTNGIDCSGFTMKVYGAFGISLPHSSSAQRSYGTGVSYSQAQPGDLICYEGHVGIYIGGGQIVNASNSQPYPKGGIKTQSATYKSILAVRRLL